MTNSHNWNVSPERKLDQGDAFTANGRTDGEQGPNVQRLCKTDSASPAPERTIAALYVATDGCYFDLDGVEAWDKTRDARAYDGPWPVVAHPPCERWGRYWGGGPSANVKRIKGDDGGCFAAALAAVRRWGGILEHPEASHAWSAFGLNTPPKCGGWVVADFQGGWTCCVEQGHFGHRARKATWLYAHGVDLPQFKWGSCGPRARLDGGYHHGDTEKYSGPRLTAKECAATPVEFRDLLISIARTALPRRSR